jgi:hypothetical protein
VVSYEFPAIRPIAILRPLERPSMHSAALFAFFIMLNPTQHFGHDLLYVLPRYAATISAFDILNGIMDQEQGRTHYKIVDLAQRHFAASDDLPFYVVADRCGGLARQIVGNPLKLVSRH